jgi:hypothetical protein
VDILSYVALVILLLMIAMIGLLIWFLGSLPGRVAADRNHPNMHAIMVGGWATLLLGIVAWPFVLMWAYWLPVDRRSNFEVDDNDSQLRDEMKQLKSKLESLSSQIQQLGAKS